MLNSVKPYTPMSDSRRRKVPIVCAGVILAALGLGAAAPSEAQAADSAFTMTNGTVRATTRAGNLNGTATVLKANSSTASQAL